MSDIDISQAAVEKLAIDCIGIDMASATLRALRSALTASGDLLREINERFIYKGHGATHWEGCEADHPECAMARRIQKVLS